MANVISDIYLCRTATTPVHQLDFTSEAEQSSYFESIVVKTVSNCSYQPRTSSIKVNGYIDDEWLQNVNYGFYINKYQGVEKKFYFWIGQKNYSAKGVTELIITIDAFQTWLFYFQFQQCMIERKHVTNDAIGSNTYPESFELGDYVTYKKHPITALQGEPCYIIGVTDGSAIGGTVFGKTYSGFTLKYYEMGDYLQLNEYIQSLATAGKADAIAFIYTFPKLLLNKDGTWHSGDEIVGMFGSLSHLEEIPMSEFVNAFSYKGDSYTPYNNKMYCYPYNFLTVKNSSGGNVVLKFELFELVSIDFYIEANLSQNPHITITPSFYDGKEYAIDDALSMQDYPLCSWNNDNYANWFAQHRNSIGAQSANAMATYNANSTVQGRTLDNSLEQRDTSMYKGVINTGAGVTGNLISGNYGGAIMNGISGGANTYLDYNQNTKNADTAWANGFTLNRNNYQNEMRSLMASVQDAKVQPNTSKGDTSASGLDLARNTATFFIEQTSIKPEYMRKIDMYFQMFGYQVNSLEIPQLRTRDKWNFIKTVNAVITHIDKVIPLEDIKMLEDIFNNGVTVWHKEEYMYNYNIMNFINA
jgi:hypothetical protein